MLLSLSKTPTIQRHGPVLASVVFIHVLMIWFMIRPFALPARHPAEQDLTAFLVQTGDGEPSLPDPSLQDVPKADVSPPQIDITGESGPSSSNASQMLIAPRPDPDHKNISPQVSVSANQIVNDVVLRILVLADGSVADAQIARSSGVPAIDALVIAFTKAHWRYLPAELGGEPVQDWTTVIVPLQVNSG